MPVGPSRVQGRISQRKLSLKEPGVHINGKRVGHSFQLLGQTLTYLLLVYQFTPLKFHCKQMPRQGLFGEEGQERKGEVEMCLAFNCWRITIITCVGLIKQIRFSDTTLVSGKQWNSTVVFLFMRWRWQFIMLLSLNATKGREQTDLGGFPWTSGMSWPRAW